MSDRAAIKREIRVRVEWKEKNIIRTISDVAPRRDLHAYVSLTRATGEISR